MPDTFNESGNRYGPWAVKKYGNNDPNPDKRPKRFSLYAFRQEKVRRSYSSGSAESYKDGWNEIPSANGFRSLPYLYQNAKYNQTLNKFKAELGQAESLFETYYERKKIAPTLIGSLRNSLKFLVKFRRKALARAAKERVELWSIVPELWLQWNFGIKPLIGEIDRVCHVMGSDPRPLDITVKNGYRHSYVTYAGDHDLSYDVLMRQKMGARVVGRNPNSYTGAELGLHRSVSALWAVMPWSWAVDYFVNVSGFLTNFEPQLVGVTVTDHYFTYFEETSGAVVRGLYDYEVTGGTYTGTLLERSLNPPLLEVLVPNVILLEDLGRAARQGSYLSSAIVMLMKGMTK